MNSFEDVFELVKKYCIDVGDIGEVALKLWINALEPQKLDGANAIFQVQSDFQKGVIINNYEKLLKEAFKTILGFDVNIVINTKTEEPSNHHVDFEEIEQKHLQLERALKQLNMTIPLTPLL